VGAEGSGGPTVREIGKREEGNGIQGGAIAAPPVSSLRWRPPQPPIPWNGVRPAEHFGQTALQHLFPLGSFLHEKLPVFIWIHGGAMEWRSGSSIPFDGAVIAEFGVIVVTINYQLGIFGLLAHPLLSRESPYGVLGYYALLDQIAAMKWVQENIKGLAGIQIMLLLVVSLREIVVSLSTWYPLPRRVCSIKPLCKVVALLVDGRWISRYWKAKNPAPLL
jgi:carboxylesterase type B